MLKKLLFIGLAAGFVTCSGGNAWADPAGLTEFKQIKRELMKIKKSQLEMKDVQKPVDDKAKAIESVRSDIKLVQEKL